MKRMLLLSMILLSGCIRKAAEQKLVFRFAGDVMFDRGIKRALGTGVKPFRHILYLSTNADIMMVNLETTIATNGDKVNKQFNFMSRPDTVHWLTNANIRLVSIANNHTMDYGASAILQTRAFLDEYQVQYTGAGMDYEQATQGVIIETNGIRFGFLAFGDIYPLNLYAKDDRPGVAGVNPKKALKVVKAFRPQVDVLAVSLHWGWEYEDDPRHYQPGIAHSFIDAGADLIIGHHPHVLQGVERYKDGVIFYSMGNFVFDQKKELKTRYTMVGEMEINLKVSNQVTNIHKTFTIHPFIKDYDDYMPRQMVSKEYSNWIDHFQTISDRLGKVRLIKQTNQDHSHFRLDWNTPGA